MTDEELTAANVLAVKTLVNVTEAYPGVRAWEDRLQDRTNVVLVVCGDFYNTSTWSANTYA